jgi:hypothetical protein
MPSHSKTLKITHSCYLITKTVIYTEDTVDIRRHMVTQNSYKYDLQAPSTRRIQDRNTENVNFVPSSIYHNL